MRIHEVIVATRPLFPEYTYFMDFDSIIFSFHVAYKYYGPSTDRVKEYDVKELKFIEQSFNVVSRKRFEREWSQLVSFSKSKGEIDIKKPTKILNILLNIYSHNMVREVFKE